MMRNHLSYQERAKLCSSLVANRLFQLMEQKKTNLALSADVTTAQALLKLADLLGPEICILKTHIDIIEDFTPLLSQQLRYLADKHHFLLFEDRKFADIGHTVQQQYAGGIYHIARWADIVNAHCFPGPSVVQGLAAMATTQSALLLIAEMSSSDKVMSSIYLQQTIKMAEQFPDFVIGFITQHALMAKPQWINMIPGVNLTTEGDKLGQCYITPEEAIKKRGADVIIVGRGIIAADNPLNAAQMYREQGWRCYGERILKEFS